MTSRGSEAAAAYGPAAVEARDGEANGEKGSERRQTRRDRSSSPAARRVEFQRADRRPTRRSGKSRVSSPYPHRGPHPGNERRNPLTWENDGRGEEGRARTRDSLGLENPSLGNAQDQSTRRSSKRRLQMSAVRQPRACPGEHQRGQVEGHDGRRQRGRRTRSRRSGSSRLLIEGGAGHRGEPENTREETVARSEVQGSPRRHFGGPARADCAAQPASHAPLSDWARPGRPSRTPSSESRRKRLSTVNRELQAPLRSGTRPRVDRARKNPHGVVLGERSCTRKGGHWVPYDGDLASSPLRGYLGVARRRWWYIALALLIAPAVAVGYSLTQPERYDATAKVLLGRQDLAGALSGLTRRHSKIRTESRRPSWRLRACPNWRSA